MCEQVTTPYENEPTGVKNQIHWIQNAYARRFQEYAPNWFEGETETDLIPLENISGLDITMLVGDNDYYCPATTAQSTADQIGEAVESVQILEGFDHGTFYYTNSEDFTERVLRALSGHDDHHDNEGGDGETEGGAEGDSGDVRPVPDQWKNQVAWIA